MALRLLILGGTAEAVQLAERVSANSGVECVYSLAGVTRRPNLPGCSVRSGGFGGSAGLADYLRQDGIGAVIDATHPFAARMAAHAATACGAEGVPSLKLLRPPWRPRPGDDWRTVPDAEEAAAVAPRLSDRVFLSSGSKDLAVFAKCEGVHFLVRLVEAPLVGIQLANHQLILARGPFERQAEINMLRRHRIGALVSKNSGGPASQAKLDAARELGLPVVMIERPAPPSGETVETVDKALDWLAALV